MNYESAIIGLSMAALSLTQTGCAKSYVHESRREHKPLTEQEQIDHMAKQLEDRMKKIHEDQLKTIQGLDISDEEKKRLENKLKENYQKTE